MNESLLQSLRVAAALGCGLMAGVFFAFSTSIMGGLSRLGPAQGIAGMQAINKAILNPAFLGVFLGTGAICAIVLIASISRLQNATTICALIGCMLYLLGSIGVTLVANVPLNDGLDTVVPNDPQSAVLWNAYLTNWMPWNHVRTATTLAGTLLLILGR